ncbi:MAG: hypothetical protein AAGA80_19135 [Cyanobacteria bacterium P01_F01_bin.143]
MNFRIITVIFLSCFFWMTSFVMTPQASALTSVELFDLDYELCSGDNIQGRSVSSGSMRPANCFFITGKANNTSGKPVVDADVFGRIYDANHNNVMANRSRVGGIPYVPPGVSDFQIRISVPSSQPTPLILEKFKASGFTGKVRPYYYDDFRR